MLRRLTVYALLALFSLPAFAETQYTRGHIVRSSDGDTVLFQPEDASSGSRAWRIRMLGMDTPEQHLPVPGQGMVGQEPWGQSATDYLQSMIPDGTSVILESHGFDTYHRVLGRLYYTTYENDSQYVDVNWQMIRSGWAIPYIYCTGPECVPGYFENEHVAEYFAACDAARQEGRGIFDAANPLDEMPFVFRMRMQRRSPNKYVGDFNTRQLFEPSDYDRVDDCRRVFFSSVEQAMAMGFHY